MKTHRNLLLKGRAAALAVLASLCTATSANALSFNFITDSTIDSKALAGFQAAGERWSNLFTDNVTLNISIGFGTMESGVIGGASSTKLYSDFTSVKAQLGLDQSSIVDALAVASLSSKTKVDMLVNRTTDNPNGANSLTPYIDAGTSLNNTYVFGTMANFRAMGFDVSSLEAEGYLDANITFSNTMTFDYNPNDGISSGTLDFVGVATHEIGHVLGFTSGVDNLDFVSYKYPTYATSDGYARANILDLFRYSVESTTLGLIDMTADTREKYFSLDNGATDLVTFSNGTYTQFTSKGVPTGRQASHWLDNEGNGIMDPTFAYGELGSIGSVDVMAFDAIGWDVRSTSIATPVPEPSTYGLMGCVGLLGVAGFKRLRRKK